MSGRIKIIPVFYKFCKQRGRFPKVSLIISLKLIDIFATVVNMRASAAWQRHFHPSIVNALTINLRFCNKS
ncbi:MAG: hypothetical protein COA94_06530 [Rickettsiales bacterium]|nr:MAG: hypothetical protein COA94_06530 [Rickettsiales bacterium]